MKKIVCDICGKEMYGSFIAEPIKEQKFCISSYGKTWDVCDKCREEFKEWVEQHKKEKNK